MSPSSKPACPEKMIAIATFQNLVLDKTPQEEIARQNRLHVPPSFGNTWNHKITLLNPVIRAAMIDTIAFIPNLVFSIPALVTMFNIWKQTSITVLFSRIIAAAATITGLKWLILFATTWIIWNALNNVLTKLVENMIARFKETKENSILDDLAKQNAWWKSEEGRAAYKSNKKAATQKERDRIAKYKRTEYSKSDIERQLSGGFQLFEETADFAYLHAAAIPATSLKSKVHIWDNKFSDMVEEEEKIETWQTLDELADGQICKICSQHVDKIAHAIIVAQVNSYK